MPLRARWEYARDTILMNEIVDPEEGLSIYNDFDFTEIYENETDVDLLWAYASIAVLRSVCYRIAAFNGVGVKERNLTKESDSIMWSRKLTDKYVSIIGGAPIKHDWLN